VGSIISKTSKNDKEKLLKIGIFLFPIGFILIIILDKILFGPRNEAYFDFAKEDGPVEYATAIFYFLASLFSGIICFISFKQKKKFFAILYLLLSSVFLVIAFEEISWGQRIFLFETPKYLEDNIQNESNFHNLPIFNNYKRYSILLVGVTGFILWVGFTFYDKLKIKPITKFFAPQGFILPYLISVIIFYGMDIFQKHLPKSPEGFLLNIFVWPDHEVFEFLLSVGIFIFVFSKFLELKSKK
jgi:hypothetical protein